jgi:hypothetical protein
MNSSVREWAGFKADGARMGPVNSGSVHRRGRGISFQAVWWHEQEGNRTSAGWPHLGRVAHKKAAQAQVDAGEHTRERVSPVHAATVCHALARSGRAAAGRTAKTSPSRPFGRRHVAVEGDRLVLGELVKLALAVGGRCAWPRLARSRSHVYSRKGTKSTNATAAVGPCRKGPQIDLPGHFGMHCERDDHERQDATRNLGQRQR